MTNLLISGETSDREPWCIDDILSTTNSKYNNYTKNQFDRIIDYENDNTIGPYCNGMTYYEIEQLNNTYNNFR